jgi:succinylarginine dihydrolase
MLTEKITEVIFVGLPGPTHHYSGLSPDNVASSRNRGSVSNPLLAALQALDLVRLLRSLGVVAAILPPQLRPHLPLLREHFVGDDESVIAQAAKHNPSLLEKSYSAASMWTANAATITSWHDATDGLLHITPANLFTNIHRRIEAEDTYNVLQAIFKNAPLSVVHPPLSAALGLRDEGAANHMRLAPRHVDTGLNIFVYGADGSARDPHSARQTLAASQALATQHQLLKEHTLFIRQNPGAIVAGVFHNDVISVSNENVLLFHEQAFDSPDDLNVMTEAYETLYPQSILNRIRIPQSELSLEEAVHSYFFNSQIVTKSDGKMALIAPLEVELLYQGRGRQLMDCIAADRDNPIDEVHAIDLRQSMRNGGGPACLRLRVPLSESQLEAVKSNINVIADDALISAIATMVETYYPDQLTSEDLADPKLHHTSRTVLEKLSQIMKLPLLG